MTVYLDINIVFDYLVGRQPFGNEVAQVITILRGDHAELYVAPNAIIMGYAFLRQQPDRKSPEQIKHSLALFRKLANCVPIENKDIDEALSKAKPADLEDGFQIVLAVKCGADIIITNDKKGFRDAPMKVMNTRDFLSDWEYSS